MIFKRRDFKIEIETINPSHSSRTYYGGWKTISGSYEWKVFLKETHELIASGKCRGKDVAMVYASRVIKNQIFFNPSRRDDMECEKDELE